MTRAGPTTTERLHRGTGAAAAVVLAAGALTAASATPAAADDLDHSPLRTLAGARTGLSEAMGVARDGAGNLYVANQVGWVTVYGPNGNGDVAPTRRIQGSATGLGAPCGVTVDAAGQIYVSDRGASPAIRVFAPDANGNVTPARTITSPALTQPCDLELGPGGTLYVANEHAPDAVLVFAASANDKTTPTRVIQGNLTKLDSPVGLAFDARGDLLVANFSGDSVTAYAATANGNAAPRRTLTGATTRLDGPSDLEVDRRGFVYVANQLSPAVQVFAAGADASTAPARSLQGANTGLGTAPPRGLAVASDHSIAVGQWVANKVSVYRAVIAPPAAPKPPATPKPRITVPGKVRALTVTGARKAKKRTIRWKAPASNGGAAITRYRLVIKKGSRTLVTKAPGAGKRSYTVKRSKLRNGKNKVSVRAVNAKGSSAWAHKTFVVRK
ncbi:beta-propeller fold lactonase family protein [Mumia sp. ZJ430]|uniref:beta-propeller fold lactonase family protein n=1 Tax=Mumia sp. ZJ430 TaxID=2708083 RepID=UPI00142091CD|nr:beta-propeller fold lactonase family protein [Mumia sp. ZJ430]